MTDGLKAAPAVQGDAAVVEVLDPAVQTQAAAGRHQICLSHQLRDLQYVVDREQSAWAQQCQALFRLAIHRAHEMPIAWIARISEYHLIASGNVLTHILNGRVMSVVVDEDVKNRRKDGLLGVQVHVGPPMKIEYRNFRLKRLAN